MTAVLASFFSPAIDVTGGSGSRIFGIGDCSMMQALLAPDIPNDIAHELNGLTDSEDHKAKSVQTDYQPEEGPLSNSKAAIGG
jgi:hypothetical protein